MCISNRMVQFLLASFLGDVIFDSSNLTYTQTVKMRWV